MTCVCKPPMSWCRTPRKNVYEQERQYRILSLCWCCSLRSCNQVVKDPSRLGESLDEEVRQKAFSRRSHSPLSISLSKKTKWDHICTVAGVAKIVGKPNGFCLSSRRYRRLTKKMSASMLCPSVEGK